MDSSAYPIPPLLPKKREADDDGESQHYSCEYHDECPSTPTPTPRSRAARRKRYRKAKASDNAGDTTEGDHASEHGIGNESPGIALGHDQKSTSQISAGIDEPFVVSSDMGGRVSPGKGEVIMSPTRYDHVRPLPWAWGHGPTFSRMQAPAMTLPPLALGNMAPGPMVTSPFAPPSSAAPRPLAVGNMPYRPMPPADMGYYPITGPPIGPFPFKTLSVIDPQILTQGGIPPPSSGGQVASAPYMPSSDFSGGQSSGFSSAPCQHHTVQGTALPNSRSDKTGGPGLNAVNSGNASGLFKPVAYNPSGYPAAGFAKPTSLYSAHPAKQPGLSSSADIQQQNLSYPAVAKQHSGYSSPADPSSGYRPCLANPFASPTVGVQTRPASVPPLFYPAQAPSTAKKD
ncbi:hypothetical protein C8A03DRAFT_38358 [Achaetomium macrosporum]|uniref:Uncharacterized protein n=1 Tax=Achaetomium macrosporum TaxID=79813 RepID=A0AAN7C285_9PEZI|nr:hypothetical protein C8A03DRAFT_38358 [Achaetomium macrosporum]